MGANITGAILSKADLSGAIFDTEQLRTVKSLKGIEGLDRTQTNQVKAAGYGHLFKE